MALACGSAACGAEDTKVAEKEPEEEGIPDVPMPPADGPPLIAIRSGVVVRDRPSAEGAALGTLSAGAKVARAEQPYSTRNCPGGWYPVRPRGFVCAGEEATIDPEHVAAKIMAPGPHFEKGLPYRYARVAREQAVTYGTLPTRAEQTQAEPKMGGYKPAPVERLGTGTNDVPLDESGRPSGPPVLMPDAEGVGEDGHRTTESWFVLPQAALSEGASLLDGTPGATETRVLKRYSGVALVGAATAGGRSFGVTADARFIPIDRLEPGLGTGWHGVHFTSDEETMVGFALRQGVRGWELEKGKAEKLDVHLDPDEIIPLSGRFRTVNNVKFYYATAGFWVRYKDMVVVNKRDKFPDWAGADQKWIDISLANQTLMAYQGHKLVFATLVSSGEDRLGDPQTGPATMQGVFRLRGKAITARIDDREVAQQFSVDDAPWVLEFAEGFSLTGCYWRGTFGEARSYHNVAVAPLDAFWLWHWSAPAIPDGWHSVTIPETIEENTIVYVHK